MSVERNLYLLGEVNEKNASKLIKELFEIIDEDELILKSNSHLVDGCQTPIPPVSLTISSHGGSSFWGGAIINTLDCLQGELHTHAIGCCASMAVHIYLQGDVRTAGDLVYFGLHGVKVTSNAYEEESRNNIDLASTMNKKFNQEVLSKTKLTEEEVKSYQSCLKWLGYEEALDKKIVTCDIYSNEKAEDEPIEAPIDESVEAPNKDEDIYTEQENATKNDENPTKVVVNNVNIRRI